jgi:hypothetical protein
MSESKRSNAEFQRPAYAATGAAHAGIEESQPRQTLELKRAMELWNGGNESGGDPYNAVGRRAISPKAA